ncbi:hypothetical protein SS50377_25230 [Spironucleus salmonicida]|uniref:Uncharacterized protein n=1 Tax=Spironucleus salmonicida TaxID=348837 RepID=A0A9P8RY23_9EUKA|nr:hypothetical protein SS50377_25230 [Spironucleus salmonicida]
MIFIPPKQHSERFSYRNCYFSRALQQISQQYLQYHSQTPLTQKSMQQLSSQKFIYHYIRYRNSQNTAIKPQILLLELRISNIPQRQACHQRPKIQNNHPAPPIISPATNFTLHHTLRPDTGPKIETSISRRKREIAICVCADAEISGKWQKIVLSVWISDRLQIYRTENQLQKLQGCVKLVIRAMMAACAVMRELGNVDVFQVKGRYKQQREQKLPGNMDNTFSMCKVKQYRYAQIQHILFRLECYMVYIN